MLKFILILLLLYLVFRLALKALRSGLFIRYRGGDPPGGGSVPPSASRRQVEEADYEVIDTQLKDNERADGWHV